jgi:hypothetical protein
MAGASPLQLTPSVVGAVQWTLVGIEVLVLAYLVAWLGRSSRLGGLARRFRRRTHLTSESAEEVGGARPARLVSAGGAAEPLRTGPRTGGRAEHATRAARALRLTRTPARAQEGIGRATTGARTPAALHCPGCGAVVARGEVATRLVTRCVGCERRVAVRLDGARVVVTLEG